MPENRISRIHAEQVLDQIAHKTAAYTMTTKDRIVNVTAATAVTITLPPVAECGGMIFSIKSVGSADAVTVQDQDDSLFWDGDYTLAAAEDAILLYSDGQSWYSLATLT